MLTRSERVEAILCEAVEIEYQADRDRFLDRECGDDVELRAAVEALQIPHSAAKYHQCVTLSIGVTSTLPTHDTQPETVLIAADRAMYNAKHDGKNRVAYSTAARTGTYQQLIVTGETPKRLS